MSRWPPVTEATRGRIVALAQAGRSRNSIARELDVSGATVTDVCARAGLTFDRGATEAATRAARADAQARRNALIPALLDDVELARAHLRDVATPADLHDCARAVSQLCLAHVRLVQADQLANAAELGAGEVDRWIAFVTSKGASDGAGTSGDAA